MAWRRLLICVFVFLVARPCRADQSAVVTDDERAKELAVQLADKVQDNADQAIEEIHTLLESSPDQSVGFCRKYWIPALLASARFQQASQLALDAILAAPWQTGAIEFLQETRIRAMLRMHLPAEALSNARSLFNVASLRGTEHALLVLTECLKADHGENAQMLRAFAKEQIAGACTRPITQTGPTSRTISEIAIESSPYAGTIAQLMSDDDQTRIAKGNLFLLAGQPEEARKVFEQLCRESESGNRAALIENVARAIKACDGTIGRANGYVLSESGAPSPQ